MRSLLQVPEKGRVPHKLLSQGSCSKALHLAEVWYEGALADALTIELAKCFLM